MADVIKKIISGNDIKNGSCVTVDNMGNTSATTPTLNSTTTVSRIESSLTNRFDDPDYYGSQFSLSDYSGLAMWCKSDSLKVDHGDGDVVSTWTDSSGNSLDLTQGTTSKKPVFKESVFKNRAALLFDGADDVLSCDSSDYASLTNYSLLLVFKIESTSGGGTFMGLGDQVAIFPRIKAFQLDASSPRNIGTISKNDAGANVNILFGTDSEADKVYIGIIINDSGTSFKQYINGAENVTSATSYDFNSYADINRLAIGASHSLNGGTTSNVYIAEVAVFDRVLTDVERNNIESKYSRKYGAAVV